MAMLQHSPSRSPAFAVHASPTRAASRPYWLFTLFAAYGPSLNVVGEMRYVEILVLGLLFLNLREVRFLGRWEMRFVGLFMFTAVVQLIADLVNDFPGEASLKRVVTYILMALLVMALKFLSRADPDRIRFILAGYCVSWAVVAVFGLPTPSAMYLVIPWRLGLGTAMTMLLCLLITTFPRPQWLGGLALLIMASIHVVEESRSMAGITAVTGLLALWASIYGKAIPARIKPANLTLFTMLAIGGMLAGYQGLKFATDSHLFPPNLQTKMALQMSSPYGLLASARPDTAAALYAISKRPILGFGAGNPDVDVAAFYSEVAASAYLQQQNHEGVMLGILDEQETLGIPSHSHLFSAWAEAGIFATPCWIATLALCAFVLLRTSFWRNEWMPLFVFVAVTTVWDVLFSPGPNRMDMAIRLMILVYAVNMVWACDIRSSSAQGWRALRAP